MLRVVIGFQIVFLQSVRTEYAVIRLFQADC